MQLESVLSMLFPCSGNGNTTSANGLLPNAMPRLNLPSAACLTSRIQIKFQLLDDRPSAEQACAVDLLVKSAAETSYINIYIYI